jgi:hypothetical protein
MYVPIYPEGIERALHNPYDCIGRACVIHKPSAHYMVGWPLNIRVDREYGLAERLCKHGVGHPDPDSLAFITIMEEEDFASASGVHGCDGCCVVQQDAVAILLPQY